MTHNLPDFLHYGQRFVNWGTTKTGTDVLQTGRRSLEVVGSGRHSSHSRRMLIQVIQDGKRNWVARVNPQSKLRHLIGRKRQLQHIVFLKAKTW